MRQSITLFAFIGFIFLFPIAILRAQENTLLVTETPTAQTTEKADPATANPTLEDQLSSPRATLKTFFRAFKDENDRHDAISTLNLSQMPVNIQDTAGPEDADRLKEIIDRMCYVNFAKVPNDKKSDTPFHLSEIATEFHGQNAKDVTSIVIARDPDGLWRFTPDTVTAIPDLYERWQNRRPVRGAFATKPEFFTPFWFQHLFPPAWTETHFLLADYQWISLISLIFLGLIADKLVRSVLAFITQICVRISQSNKKAQINPSVFRPVGLLTQGFIWYEGTMLLGIPDSALSIMIALLKLFTVVAGVWTAFLLINALRAYMIIKTGKTVSKHDDLLVLLISRAIKVFIVCVGILIAARAFDLPIIGILGGMGLGGIAIALASKDAISNLIGSFGVLVDRPFEVGDWVVVNTVEGTVEAVGFRSTRIRTFSNSLITLPNSVMITTVVNNMGARRFRRIKTVFSVQYDTTPEQINAFCEGIRELIRRHPYTRKEYYHVYLNNFGDSSLQILLYCFLECPDWSIELREQHRLLNNIHRLAVALQIKFNGKYTRDPEASAPPLELSDPDLVGRRIAARIAGPALDLTQRPGPVVFAGPTDFDPEPADNDPGEETPE